MIAEFLKDRDNTTWRYNALVLELLKYVLSRNVFVFNGSYYLPGEGGRDGD